MHLIKISDGTLVFNFAYTSLLMPVMTLALSMPIAIRLVNLRFFVLDKFLIAKQCFLHHIFQSQPAQDK